MEAAGGGGGAGADITGLTGGFAGCDATCCCCGGAGAGAGGGAAAIGLTDGAADDEGIGTSPSTSLRSLKGVGLRLPPFASEPKEVGGATVLAEAVGVGLEEFPLDPAPRPDRDLDSFDPVLSPSSSALIISRCRSPDVVYSHGLFFLNRIQCLPANVPW